LVPRGTVTCSVDSSVGGPRAHGSFGIGNPPGVAALGRDTRPERPAATGKRVPAMLYWTLIFLVIALVAGLFGFGGVASASAGIAKVLFAIFLVLFLVSLIFGVIRGA
jgi:uncharacterized membrane protein YtjA (UPF0391 family)